MPEHDQASTADDRNEQRSCSRPSARSARRLSAPNQDPSQSARIRAREPDASGCATREKHKALTGHGRHRPAAANLRTLFQPVPHPLLGWRVQLGCGPTSASRRPPATPNRWSKCDSRRTGPSSQSLKKSAPRACDEAVLRALDNTEVLPRDTDGRVPSGPSHRHPPGAVLFTRMCIGVVALDLGLHGCVLTPRCVRKNVICRQLNPLRPFSYPPPQYRARLREGASEHIAFRAAGAIGRKFPTTRGLTRLPAAITFADTRRSAAFRCCKYRVVFWQHMIKIGNGTVACTLHCCADLRCRPARRPRPRPRCASVNPAIAASSRAWRCTPREDRHRAVAAPAGLASAQITLTTMQRRTWAPPAPRP